MLLFLNISIPRSCLLCLDLYNADGVRFYKIEPPVPMVLVETMILDLHQFILDVEVLAFVKFVKRTKAEKTCEIKEIKSEFSDTDS